MGRGSAVAILVAFLLSVCGCRGNPEFRRGLELEESGDLRGAYLEFFKALELSPSDGHREALGRVGEAIALGRLREGFDLERANDLRGALERFALALEYAPRFAAVRAAYRRVQEELTSWERAKTRSFDAEIASTSPPKDEEEAWSRALARIELASHAACPSDERAEHLTASVVPLEAWANKLERRTFDARLGIDEAPVRVLLGGWQRFDARLLDWIEWEDETVVFGRSDAAGVPTKRIEATLWMSDDSWGPHLEASELRERLEALRRRAVRASEFASVVLEAIAIYREGQRQERSGDLVGAYGAFRRGAHRHRGAVEARLAAERVLGTGRRQAYETSQAAMARGEWSDAIRRLDELERIAGEYRDSAERIAFCREELARENRRAGADFAARELPGNALLRYLEAARAAPQDTEVGREIERLERALDHRVRPRLTIEFAANDDEEALLRRWLWKVGEDAIASVEAQIAGSFFRRRGLTPGDSAVRVVVEDLDFAFFERTATRSMERSRFLRSFRVVRDPRAAEARQEVARREVELEAAKRALEAAPGYRRSMLRDVVELARGRLESARRASEVYDRETPVVRWEERSYPVKNVAVVAELAARFRIDRFAVERKWVNARWEKTDRVVDDDDADLAANKTARGRGALFDPLEMPPREEIVEKLAADLGRRLRREVEAVSAEQRVRYYHLAIERLESGSLELAVENLVTYHHAGRGEEPTLQSKDALRRLELLTRSDTVRAWARAR